MRKRQLFACRKRDISPFKTELKPEVLCKCGDDIESHINKTGPCRLNWAHNFGEGKCEEFRLAGGKK